MQEKFEDRHIGITPQQMDEMLKVIGVSSVEELMDQVIPSNIRTKGLMNLTPAMSEWQFTNHITELGAKNKIYRSLIGMGYYGTATLAAVMRNVFENPAWYTSYTPYQAEISQGRLEALLNYQTAITSITGMELSNCSLLDDATAAAEAMSMMFSSRSRAASKEGRNVLFVDENVFPQVLDLLLTRSEPLGIELAIDNYDEYEFTGKEFGAVLQYPAADGLVCDYSDFTAKCHEKEILVTAVCDILSLAVLEAPATWGADIAVGSTQRFGIPMGFGGPAAGYLACKESFKRVMPGRIIGVSLDRLGNPALRMALQTREQHIKRERATSNICTASALMATMAGMYAIYHGAEGLTRIANTAHWAAKNVATALTAMGFSLSNQNYFDTLELVVEDTEKLKELSLAKKINFGYIDGGVRISFDELSTQEEIQTVVSIFSELSGVNYNLGICPMEQYSGVMKRTTPFFQEDIFNKYRSETKLMRYIKKLELRDISLANSMISLGSCTMKLNSAASMMPLSSAQWGAIHPFVPADQREGYTELIELMDAQVSEMMGFARTSFQPNSGAAGEYAGLMVMRGYLMDKGEGHRNVVLIPASAHGTNPASAAMVGLKIIVTKCDENGNIDLVDWKEKAELHAKDLFGCMITYPSTHGIFESRITELCDIIHANGGQVYYDGANMNAAVGLTSPGAVGADVCHLNLHKTFAMPHGGGGPGVGSISVAEHLVPFLPSHPIIEVGGELGITAVAAAPYGSAMLLPITYGYVCMMGAEGLARASKTAIVSANYMASALKGQIEIVYSGETGRVGHEMILDYRRLRQDLGGVECGDIARRLMDYGFHAPTLSFPVHDTLMVEPTESESKDELDRFISALLSIKAECEANITSEDHIVKNAPHPASEVCSDSWSHTYSRESAAYPLEWSREFKFWPYVSKVDNGYGDRNLVCNCSTLESYL